MEFSFEKYIDSYPLFYQVPALDMFTISQLNATTFEAQYKQPAAEAEQSATETATDEVSSSTPGKQKKSKKRRSVDAAVKPYPLIKCPECPKTYRDNVAGQRHLQLHLTTHDPEAKAKFVCDKCSKTFSNEVYLKRHFNLCGTQKRRRSSVGSSTHDESSNDTFAEKTPDDIQIINEGEGEVQIDFQAF